MTPEIMQKITFFLALVFSLSIHEYAHALFAKWQGDSTAEDLGRLTINPIAHIDPIGTLAFPLIASFFGVPLIGWAKPVPVNPSLFKSQRWGDAIVAFAGPLSNLILCFIALLMLAIHQVFLSDWIHEGHLLYSLTDMAQAFVIVNALLAFFNLIPLPPLDGGSVFGAFLPRDLYEKFYRLVAPYGIFILFIIMYSSGFKWIQVAAGYYIGFAKFLISLPFIPFVS